MKTASQILGSSFFLQGFEVQDAPRYGAERRGAPVFAFVRAARGPIHERGAIARPDLVVVADETLVPIPVAGVLQGVNSRTVVLIYGGESAETWQTRLKLDARIMVLAPDDPGSAEMSARAGLAAVGAICAGAAAGLTGAVSRENLAGGIRAELSRHGEVTLRRNLSQALAAFDRMAPFAGQVQEGQEVSASGYVPPDWIRVPIDDASLATPDIHAAATSELARTGLWRTLRPVIDYTRCKRCAWVCSTLCPDGAIRVDADHTPRIDYDQCKGCAVCVTVCPPHAVSAVPERELKKEAQAL